MVFEIIATVANLGALTVIGFIYAAYVKNLRTMNSLKETQLKVAEQNVKLWKDKAIELERKSPEFIEKQLNERIKIREEEIERLAIDSDNHVEKISLKNDEIEKLNEAVNKAHQYRKSISVWDRDERDFIEIPHSELEQKPIGSLCVDSASLMICDPFYLKMRDEQEKEDFKTQTKKYKVVETGEFFCTDLSNDYTDMELLGLDEELTPEQMLAMGLIEEVEYSGDLPAIESTYIKGGFIDPERVYRQVRHYSFLNGRVGAGISISLGGDGVYPVSVESYKGELQRIIIDI
jgi:hypothetical protein